MSSCLVMKPTTPEFVSLKLQRQSKTGTIILEFINMNKPCVELQGIDSLYPSVTSAHSTIFKFLRRNNEFPVRVVRFDKKLFLLRTDITE